MPSGESVKSQAREAHNSKTLELLARLGLFAKGLIYVLIGVLALQVAFGGGGKEADRQGATREIATTPFGTVLLWVLVIGFAGNALWRLSEVFFGAAEPDGNKASARAKSGFKTVLYGAFSVSTLLFVTGKKSSGSGEEQSKNISAKVMEVTGGRFLIGIAGLVFIGAAGMLAYQAVTRAYRETMKMQEIPPKMCPVVDGLGVGGGVARAVIFTLVGVFLIVAAVQFDPNEAKGLDGSLKALRDTPVGPWLLVLVALGLVAFGLFTWVEARYRKT